MSLKDNENVKHDILLRLLTICFLTSCVLPNSDFFPGLDVPLITKTVVENIRGKVKNFVRYLAISASQPLVRHYFPLLACFFVGRF